jgi:hypothetical protein
MVRMMTLCTVMLALARAVGEISDILWRRNCAHSWWHDGKTLCGVRERKKERKKEREKERERERERERGEGEEGREEKHG